MNTILLYVYLKKDTGGHVGAPTEASHNMLLIYVLISHFWTAETKYTLK